MRKTLMSGLKRLTVAALAVCMATTAVACKDNDTGNGPDEEPPVVSVSAPTISSFSIKEDTGAAYGKMNETHKLVWTINGDYTGTAVSVKLSGEAAAAADYEYTEQTQKIVFKTIGSYTVTLKASNGDKSTSKSATIDISEFSAPVITMPQDASGYMNTAVSFEPTITYDTADSAKDKTVAVKLDGANAAENTDYTLTGGQFTPKKVGEYKVTVSVTSEKGKSASSTWTYNSLEIGAAAVNKDADNLASFGTEDDRLLVETNKATAFVYTAQNYDATLFDVAVSLKKGETPVESAVQHNATTRTLTVTAAETGDYTLGITFTNKTDVTKTSSVTWDIRVKNDIAAPELGEDPFDGTWNKLIPNVGMALYFDATDDKVQNLTYSNVKYEIVSNADSSATAAGAQIVDTGAYANHPYLIATGTGKVTVKMTVSDGVNTATANKEFTVEAAAANRPTDTYFANAYKGTNTNIFNSNQGVWVGNGSGATDSAITTLVATKNGLIYAHSAYVADVVSFLLGDVAISDFTIEMDLTPLALYSGVGSAFAVRGYNGSDHLGCIGVSWRDAVNDKLGGWGDGSIKASSDTANAVPSKTDIATELRTYKYKVQKAGGTWTVSIDGDVFLTITDTSNRPVTFIATNGFDSGNVMIENITLTRN